MPLPRSCVCGSVHHPGQRCGGNKTADRMGKGWAKISRKVLERDRYVCQLRLTGCVGRATTADHITPRWRGGSNAMSNLRAACGPCNTRRGAGA